MHNGEKGIWEKWTLFDESTRVPLLISHPKSPFQGSHYKSPVELIDIYPTVLDLVQAPYDVDKVCKFDNKCKPLQGKSLAGVILGDDVANKIDELYVERKTRPDRCVFNFTLYFYHALS
jgi:arylsulfatase A-like enzyme